MKNSMTCLLAVAFVISVGMIAGCDGGDSNGDEDPCNYDDATAACQKAHDCCMQMGAWGLATNQIGINQDACPGFTCLGMQDVTCDEYVVDAIQAEQAYAQDWPACH